MTSPYNVILSPLRILLVEDNPGDAMLVREVIREDQAQQITLVHVTTIGEAVLSLQSDLFDIVLLDLDLPDSDGIHTIERVRTSAPQLPIVVLTGMNDESLALPALKAGAQDYLIKGKTDQQLLIRVIHHAIWRKQAEDHLVHLATHDAVTRLPTRLLFLDRLRQAISSAGRQRKHVAVLFLDIDNFKSVNDTLGHPTGDLLLKAVADRLSRSVREGDTVARMGGDEFILIVDPGSTEARYFYEVAHKILDLFVAPFFFAGNELLITVSIGIAVYPEDGQDPDTLLRNADMALLRVKEQGRNNYQHYSAEMHEKTIRRLTLGKTLAMAIQQNELELYYQPIQEILSGQVIGMEALIRWFRSPGEMLMPSEFIPIAEETGVISRIGEWTLRTVCRQGRAWRDAGLPLVPIAVNLSAHQLQQEHFIERTRRAIEESGLPANYVAMELTEGVAMRQTEKTIVTLTALHRMGVSLLIDDFGTGYSSLSYLRNFPITTLKIDISFIRGLGVNPDDLTIVRAIIALSHNLGLSVIAEGVETREQLEHLRLLQCDQIQGNLFSPPLSLEDMTAFLSDHRALVEESS